MPAIGDYKWLTSGDADAHFHSLMEANKPLNGLEALRKVVGIERARLVLQQIELRIRAKSKFSKATEMFFTRKSLEQATDEEIAELKARRFEGLGTIADICCGIGGDTLALGRVSDRVDAIDSDEIATLFCAKNCIANGLGNVSVQQLLAAGVDISKYDAWHIDPDRRDSGTRTVCPKNFAPSLSAIVSLIDKNPNAAVKLAPATEIESDWLSEAELHWIGHRRSCQQMVAYFGALAEHPGKRVATVIGDQSHRTVIDRAEIGLHISPAIGEFVYEPHAAILAARCSGQIAEQHELAAIIPGGGYLTSNHLRFDPAMASFQVLESMPFHEKKVRQALRKRDAGMVEVKKRAVDVNPNELQAKWKGKGDNRLTVFVLRRNHAVSAIIAQRVSIDESARLT